ncbi:MAG: hypothetical protein WCE90_02350 [Candidatus Zixiibacteriota bacterium]
MANLNQRLLGFFAGHFKPGIIGLVGTKDGIGLAIREAQRKLTPDGKPSLWSHCFVLGQMRLDKRGPGGSKMQSPYIFESDLVLKLFKLQLRNGAQENWVGKWCQDKVENAAVIDFGLQEGERDMILATALQLVDEQVLYPIEELLGTWWAIVMKKQWLPNPVDDPHAMYCSSYVRYCYMETQRDFLGHEVTVSNTTPEHIAQAGIKAGAIRMYG